MFRVLASTLITLSSLRESVIKTHKCEHFNIKSELSDESETSLIYYIKSITYNLRLHKQNINDDDK